MERELFLARLQSRSVAVPPEPPSLPASAGEPSIAQFSSQVAAVGGRCYQVARSKLAEQVVAISVQYGLTTFAAWATSNLAAARAALRAAGRIEMDWKNAGHRLRPNLGEVSFGLVEADFGVAETGTLGLTSSPERPRLISCLPRVLIATLDVCRLVCRFEDVVALRSKGGLPSALSLVTGVSCTGDIDVQMIEGAHGPSALHLIITE